MGTITINFVGICTHFHKGYVPGVPHRVVCVDGRSIPGIKPHFVTLSYAEREGEPPMAQMRLHRQRVRLFSGTREYQNVVTYDCDYHKIPSLHDHTRPSEEVFVARRGAAVFFDLRGGAFGHGCHGQAHTCCVTIDDIEAPSLELSSFDDLFSKTRIRIPDGAVVELRNTERYVDPDDPDKTDFLLHYLVSGEMPDKSKWIPTDKEACQNGACKSIRDDTPVALNVGCSNSTFP
jgi:hypothetical protein